MSEFLRTFASGGLRLIRPFATIRNVRKSSDWRDFSFTFFLAIKVAERINHRSFFKSLLLKYCNFPDGIRRSKSAEHILQTKKTKFINGSKTSVLKFHKKHFPPVRLHRTGRKRNSVNKQIAARKFRVAGKVDAKLAETGFISGSRKMRNMHLATG